ncbi:hypothetical protein DRJ53_16645 [Paracnuella aquatica]|nr:hypothetical protein DRJ53_16645 [Paracnuella aquatica]
MKEADRVIRRFFWGQNFADGFRTTVAVLVPTLLGAFLGATETGILFSLGALAVSITDTPGAIRNRTNTMLFSLFFTFLTALATISMRPYLVGMGVLIFVLSFFFSMLLVYGNRGGAVGSAALLVMVLTMEHDQTPAPHNTFVTALFILLGGGWYTVISLLSYHIRPFRMAQRTLGECVQEVARYLRIKADFYDCNIDLEGSYRRLVTQHMEVSQKQDDVRQILFKTRQIVKDSSTPGRRLLLAFTDTVDLFEETTASFYDYRMLRKNFAETGMLQHIATIARSMANELESIGLAIQSNTNYVARMDFSAAIQDLKKEIDALQSNGDQSNLILKRLLVNIRRMMQRMEDLRLYFGRGSGRQKESVHLDRFVSHQSLEANVLWSNMNFNSSVFRFSLRVAIAALVGFAVSKFIAVSHHSYWILMTTIYMLKPSFSLTRQRNIERIVGTLAGGAIGIGLLLLVHDKNVLFGLLVLLMLGTYSLIRTQYLAAVALMTPFLLIFFHFMGMSLGKVVEERVVDTLLGCIIALLAGYLLFPTWERDEMEKHLKDMLKANSNYLFRVAEMFQGKVVALHDYKLARKEVYVSSANLAAAFQRMLSEPKKTRRDSSHIQQFVVLNHILFSNIATLASTLRSQPEKVYPAELNRAMRKLINTLCTSLEQMNTPCSAKALESLAVTEETGVPLNTDEVLLKRQIEFMQRLGEDIAKAGAAVAA